MTALQIAVREASKPNPDGIAELEMRVGHALLTRLLRRGAAAEDAAVRIPAAPLAFWFAENWWRLRWEPRTVPPSASWRMAHEMPAIGHGHAWPRVTIWGDRDRVMLLAQAHPPGVIGPVRFLTNAIVFVPAGEFEAAVDGLLDQAVSIAPRTERPALTELITALRTERRDEQCIRWRRMEAVGGYGPDEAPEELMDELVTLERTFPVADVEEAVAAFPGERSAQVLKATVDAAGRAEPVDFSAAMQVAPIVQARADRLLPWMVAEKAAEALRARLGQPTQPLRNQRLSELAGMSAGHLRTQPAEGDAAYALRLTRSPSRSTVLLTARWGHDRRFQLARAIGDAIWSGGSELGAISNVSSSRQKFQRAFAAALLCPEEGLREFLGTSDPGDSDIGAAARHFHVNEKTVRTVLVNKHLIERERLGQPLNDPRDGSRLEELAEVA